MHAIYELNYAYPRLPLEEYSKCLEATFSVYEAIELNYMPGNFTKNSQSPLPPLRNWRTVPTLKILYKSYPKYQTTGSRYDIVKLRSVTLGFYRIVLLHQVFYDERNICNLTFYPEAPGAD